MTFTYKTLGQQAPAAATPADLYTCPALTSAIVEGVTICNRSSAQTFVRLSVSVGGGATADKDYLLYDVPVPGNTTVDVNAVATMAAGDVLRCYATDATISFNAFGVEIS